MSQEIVIESYSEKAIAVFGDTKAIKDHLLAMNGKFNPSLRGNGDEKRAGWIFPKTKLDEVKKLVDSAKSNQLSTIPSTEKKVYTKKVESQSNDFIITKDMYLSLISRIEKLESELTISKKIIEKLSPIPTKTQVKPTIVFQDDEDDEDVEVSEDEDEEKTIAPKRLLSRR